MLYKDKMVLGRFGVCKDASIFFWLAKAYLWGVVKLKRSLRKMYRKAVCGSVLKLKSFLIWVVSAITG